MTKPLIVLALLAAVNQAAYPVPGQTASTPPTVAIRQPQRHPDHNNNPTAQAASIQQSENPAIGGQERATNHTEIDQQHPVIVSKLPTVTVGKDGWDCAYIIGTWCLVAIGAAGILFALRTVKAIEEQGRSLRRQIGVMRASLTAARRNARAAKISADAAKLSADVAKGVAVPTLQLCGCTLDGTGLSRLHSPRFNIVLKNYGQTPAFLRAFSVKVTCEPLPDPLDYNPIHAFPADQSVAEFGKPLTLPKDTWPPLYVSGEDIKEVISRNKLLWVYGFVRYGSLFEPDKTLPFNYALLNFGGNGSDPEFVPF